MKTMIKMKNGMKKISAAAICAALFFSCSSSDGGGGNSGEGGGGVGGSMARFCITDDLLYVVDDNSLKLFGISEPASPVFYETRTQNLGFGIETVFRMDTLLFIGSSTGMYIYDIRNPEFPAQLSMTRHITSCDPVVAEGQYAYVTLNSANIWCGRTSNVLDIYDISNPVSPVLKKTVGGFNSPLGLGVDGNRLFVCDQGLKVYDISNPEAPRQIADNYTANADVRGAYDVIPRGGTLILVASNGLFQFDYSGETLKLLSKINIKQ
ncbi:MAG: hypothetical protein LBD35_01320 [Prevotellaceae bacterium]|nr:hypothetical protein [Prevotellaceae bacterium]